MLLANSVYAVEILLNDHDVPTAGPGQRLYEGEGECTLTLVFQGADNVLDTLSFGLLT